MTGRADATLDAIVANVADTGTRWLFEPDAVAPMRADGSRPISVKTVCRHLEAAGYAVDTGGGWMELTPAGLAAVEAARAARGGAA